MFLCWIESISFHWFTTRSDAPTPGDSGEGWAGAFNPSKFPATRMIFPTAPTRYFKKRRRDRHTPITLTAHSSLKHQTTNFRPIKQQLNRPITLNGGFPMPGASNGDEAKGMDPQGRRPTKGKNGCAGVETPGGGRAQSAVSKPPHLNTQLTFTTLDLDTNHQQAGSTLRGSTRAPPRTAPGSRRRRSALRR